jgi:hypothetical protein
MRPFILIAILVSIELSCVAQDESQQIINDALHKLQDSGAVVYVTDKYGWYDNAKDVLLKGKLSGGDQETRQNRLVLTADDKKIVKEQLSNPRSGHWIKDLVTNSKSITNDSLTKILFNKEKGWTFFHREFGKGYFQISDPIFIRNNSFAFVNLIQMLDYSAGHKLLYVYKKQNQTWKRFILVVLGAW